MENAQPSDLPHISRVGIKIPPFWPEDPAVWFAQLEAQFTLANITQYYTKYYYAISQLDGSVTKEVKDIVPNPPETGKLNKLKTELIDRLTFSQEQRVHQLLTHEEIGDRRPSQCLRHLANLGESSIPQDFLRTLWSNRLPTHIQAVIATQRNAPLDDVAKLADTVNEVTPQAHVALTSPSGDIASLIARINDLAQQVASLTVTSRSPQSRKRSNIRARSPSSNHHNGSANPVCWYHRRYKEHAKRCTTPHVLLFQKTLRAAPNGG